MALPVLPVGFSGKSWCLFWRIHLGLLQPAGTCHRACVTELKDPILMCLPLTHKFIVWQKFDSQNGAAFAQ